MYFEVFRDATGFWRWRLKAANHRVIADSAESYRNRGDAVGGIELIRAGAAYAQIFDV